MLRQVVPHGHSASTVVETRLDACAVLNYELPLCRLHPTATEQSYLRGEVSIPKTSKPASSPIPASEGKSLPCPRCSIICASATAGLQRQRRLDAGTRRRPGPPAARCAGRRHAHDRAILGEFTVTVESEGFSQKVYPNVTLEAGQKLNLNVMLAVGSVHEEVTVTGAPGLLNTSDATGGPHHGRRREGVSGDRGGGSKRPGDGASYR